MSSEPGAPPAGGFIPLCVPEIRGNEWRYVKECLDTGWVSSVGAYVTQFEEAMAGRAGVEHAVAATSGTAALHTALLAAGVRPGDEVLVSTLSFVAPANTIRYAGAWPVFIDAEPVHWQMDVARVADFLENECRREGGELRNRATGRPVRAVMPVHILGHPVDMDPLMELARRHGLVVIEDATESLGALYKGQPVGSLGDLACFSFNGNKIITTGGGGMLVTRRAGWAERARYLTTQAKDDPVEFVHNEIGYNYRLTNIQAAMGCAQLELLDSYVAAKRSIAARYAAALADVPGIRWQREASWAFSTCWLSTLLADESVPGLGSRELIRRLAGARIQSRPLWQPLHLSPAHAGAPGGPWPVAERLNREAASLPSSVGLTDEGLERVVQAVREWRASTGGVST